MDVGPISEKQEHQCNAGEIIQWLCIIWRDNQSLTFEWFWSTGK